MKKLFISLLFFFSFLSGYSQELVPLSDVFIKKHNIKAGDFGRLQVYAKFVNSHIYKVALTSPEVYSLNAANKIIKIRNLTPGVILNSNYIPSSHCTITVDFGSGAIIAFTHEAYDNDFYIENGTICIMLFTDDIAERPAPPPDEVVPTGRKVVRTLQEIIDNAPDNSTLNIPEGNYTIDYPIDIGNRNSLTLMFTSGTEVYSTNLGRDVVTIWKSNNIKIKNGHFKHIKLDKPDCTGAVIHVADCDNILIENCDINGCGRIGVEASRKVNYLTVKNCYIHDNSQAAFDFTWLYESTGIKLLSNRIEDNQNFLEGSEEHIKQFHIKLE